MIFRLSLLVLALWSCSQPAAADGRRGLFGNHVRCPKVKTLEKFSLADLAGTWYELERTPVRAEYGTSCFTDNITVPKSDQDLDLDLDDGNGNATVAQDSISFKNDFTGFTESGTGTVSLPDPSRPALVRWDFPGTSLGGPHYAEVISYKAGEHIASYNCCIVEIFGRPLYAKINAWVSSPNRNLGLKTLQEINAGLRAAGLPTEGLHILDQSKCNN